MNIKLLACIGVVVALGHGALLGCFSCEGIPVPSTYHRTVANSGNWSSTTTWQGGSLPAAGHNILVPAGKTLTVDLNSTTLYGTIVVEGTLNFRTSANTKLHCDTILVAENAGFDIGTSSARVPAANTVEIVFDGGNLSLSHDPKLVTRGLVSEGRVGIWGSNKTAFRSLATTSGAPASSTITLSSAPTGWRVGDQIVVTGVTFRPRANGTETIATDDEVRTLSAISADGLTLTLDAPLAKDHRPNQPGMRAYAANLTRNVRFSSPSSLAIHQRGHVMFMGTKTVQINGASFKDLGRTSKTNPVRNPATAATAATDNIRGRYPVHFHKMDRFARDLNKPYRTAAATFLGNTVWGSPGWGVATHGSWVNINDNVTFDIFASHFVAEDGDERGQLYRNIAIRSNGDKDRFFKSISWADGVNGHDTGFNGHGYWLESRNLDVADNIAVSHQNAAFFFFHRNYHENVKIPVEFLLSPHRTTLAKGKTLLAIDDAPITSFLRNTAIASLKAIHVVKANPNQGHDIRNFFDTLKGYNVKGGIELEYTARYSFKNFEAYRDPTVGASPGVVTGNVTRDLALVSPKLVGFSKPVQVSTVFGAINSGLPLNVPVTGGYADTPDILFVDGQVDLTADSSTGLVSLNPASHIYNDDNGGALLGTVSVIKKVAASSLTSAAPSVSISPAPRIPDALGWERAKSLDVYGPNVLKTDSAGLAAHDIPAYGIPSYWALFHGTEAVKPVLQQGYYEDAGGAYVLITDAVSDRVDADVTTYTIKAYFNKTAHAAYLGPKLN